MNSYKASLSAALLFGISSVALAIPVHTEITIYDGDGVGVGWAGAQEDDETEPGTVQTQEWDLESMFTYGTNLIGMISGYNFYNTNSNPDYRPGDIFIDIDGSYIAGNTSGANGQNTVANSFGYEYVLDVDWTNFTYDILQISPAALVTTTFYGINYGSSPWRYVSGGTSLGSGSFTPETGLTNAQAGKSGGQGAGANAHYAAYGFDLSFLPVGTVFTAHFTSSCGNDNLMGSSTVVPVPAAVWLLGSALGLLGVIRRRARS